MIKKKVTTKAEKREVKNRKRMHMSGRSVRTLNTYAGMSIIKHKPKRT